MQVDPHNPGAVLFRDLGDGRGIWVYPMMYTFKLVIGSIGSRSYDDGWCYADLGSALSAVAFWNPATEPEPSGWVRHPQSGRRRFPDGDPASEEVSA